jgi:hypothetical protein
MQPLYSEIKKKKPWALPKPTRGGGPWTREFYGKYSWKNDIILLKSGGLFFFTFPQKSSLFPTGPLGA